MLALEQQGVAIRVYAVTDPHEELVQPRASALRARVRYLEAAGQLPLVKRLGLHAGVLLRHPAGYLRALLSMIKNGKVDQGYVASPRWQTFSHAVYLVELLDGDQRETGRPVRHLHAHFAHDPAMIAQLAHQITGIHYSFTAHARDLFQLNESVLAGRVRQAENVVTCCRANLEYLEKIIPSQRSKFELIYHGLDLQEFQDQKRVVSRPEVPIIVSAGRLVAKKGFIDLLQALECAKNNGAQFHCLIYGDGPLRDELQAWIETHGLSRDVVLAGSLAQQEYFRCLREASLFILTPAVTEDGDRDGIPNVLLEALAAGLPVISTRVAGIPEAVHHRVNGLLFRPHDIAGISAGVCELLENPQEGRRFGEAGRRMVASSFDIRQTSRQMKEMLAGCILRAG